MTTPIVGFSRDCVAHDTGQDCAEDGDDVVSRRLGLDGALLMVESKTIMAGCQQFGDEASGDAQVQLIFGRDRAEAVEESEIAA